MRRLLTLLFLAVAITPTSTAYVPDTLTVTFLDVGEADPAIVQAPNGHAMLVDAERLEFVDTPGHAEDLKRYRARGYRMVNNRFNIVTDYPRDLVEVHPPSRGKVDLDGMTIEQRPPAPAMG